MSELKNVQYVYAQELNEQERKDLGICVDSGLVAIETRASTLTRTPKILKEGIVKYLWSLEKEKQ